MRLKRWVGWWVAAVGVGSGANIAVWLAHADGPVRLLSNIASVAALPVWIPLRLAHFTPIQAGAVGIVLANAAAGIVWVIGILALLRLRDALARREPVGVPADASRRAFLANSAAGVVGVGVVSVPGYATVMEPWNLSVRRYEIPVRGLPAGLDGLRVVQFSDPHLGPRMPRQLVSRAVRMAADLRPDLVALTGDYIHEGEQEIDRFADVLRPLISSARLGAVGVLGNHDWYGNGPRVSQALRDAGVAMIDNGRVWLAGDGTLRAEDPGDGLAIVGLGDLTEDAVDVTRAFGGIDPGTPRVVLAHQPDTAELSELKGQGSPRMDLMLCGHTHGGQVRIPFLGTPIIPSRYGQKYAGGLINGPACPVLVSRGVGLSVLPVRIGVPPEIGLITFRRS